MPPLAAMQELAELAASYSAAHERSRASHPSKAAAREADAALRLAAIVVVTPPSFPRKREPRPKPVRSGRAGPICRRPFAGQLGTSLRQRPPYGFQRALE